MGVDQELLETICGIDNVEELAYFFDELLTLREVEDISLRWKLLLDLHNGMTQRKIAQKYGISLCKITRGSKILKKKESMVLKILQKRTSPALCMDDSRGK
ncbi:MAG: transcriptional regulator [Desulfamplus sp.]|nr:transcriptional regulator [Desulfamplus sp.]